MFSRRALVLDNITAQSLEITQPAAEGGKSLADTIDATITPMGRRLLREWLLQPSGDIEEIHARHDAVEFLKDHTGFFEALRTLLLPIRDLGRLATKVSLRLAMPRDLLAIKEALVRIPTLQKELHATQCAPLQSPGKILDPLLDLTQLLNNALEDELPATYREGGIFRASFHPEVAETRALSQDGKSTIAAMEAAERERTGISSLKIKFSKVFGYTLEITNTHLAKVPPHYIRKQTISTGERFITPELKAFEEKVIHADYRLKSLEESLSRA